MEQHKNLDIKTLLVLMVEYEDAPLDKLMAMIAEEAEVPADRLKAALTKSVIPEREVATSPKPTVVKTVKRSYSRWGDERLNELVNRWNHGEKPGQIAKEMGVSTQTVYQKISKLRKDRDDIKPRSSRNPAFQARG